jgi:hypothetical protein
MAQIINNEKQSLDDWSPLRFVKLACAGSLIIGCQFLFIALNTVLVTLHGRYFGHRVGLFVIAASILLLFGPLLTGIASLLVSYWQLWKGLDLKWSESQIQAAHRWAEAHDASRTAKWVLGSFLVAEIVSSYLLFHVWKVPHHSAMKLFFDSLTLWCIPPLVVWDIKDRLRLALPKQPTSRSPSAPTRLHSEQWGG